MFKSKKKKNKFGKKRIINFVIPQEAKNWILGVLMIVAAAIIGLSFFNKAGIAGRIFMRSARFLIGETVFITPLILILGGLVFLFSTKYNLSFNNKKREVFWSTILAVLILILGTTGILGSFNKSTMKGGWVGYFLSWPFLKYFGFWATQVIFLAPIIIAALIFWHFLRPVKLPSRGIDGEKEQNQLEQASKPSIIKKIFAPKFRVKEVPHFDSRETRDSEEKPAPLNDLNKKSAVNVFSYQPPSLTLLESEHGSPTSGDTKTNSAIIQKTLQNFGIDVMMSEINIGPTVTQYTLKPAEGIKLSKITSLANDLALALASHPIRIEAPIPGRSLVGIELPNKGRAQVRLRNLIENSGFQNSSGNLLIALGKDVSGVSLYADLTKMPHLLVAGSTGAGKTIFLNTLLLSLLYQPTTAVKNASPKNLRLILVDPKRVEFPVYSHLPHLLCPVIYNASKTVNVLKWLTGEMERRFDILAEAKARDIGSFNEKALKTGTDLLPFIVLVIDELADLMAVKGKEIEAAIVRLAQMSRAVGIHLVVATQRPSVEIITGLIKANITSRVTFQVASQVDSRTIIDMAGAERLLGAGDMLFISKDYVKPKRIQGAYISDKEVKRVVEHINSNFKIEEMGKQEQIDAGVLEGNRPLFGSDTLALDLEKSLDSSGAGLGGDSDDDILYEQAKQTVVQASKASASLLQRRLRIGYARAARLIDMLEERGVVGPAEGAKPREVYMQDDGFVDPQAEEN